jgi:DNA-binding XRE family transcriptional regulator
MRAFLSYPVRAALGYLLVMFALQALVASAGETARAGGGNPSPDSEVRSAFEAGGPAALRVDHDRVYVVGVVGVVALVAVVFRKQIFTRFQSKDGGLVEVRVEDPSRRPDPRGLPSVPTRLPAPAKELSARELRDARTKSGRSQEQLAQEVGVSRATISAWEKGRRPIPPDRTAQLRKALATHL